MSRGLCLWAAVFAVLASIMGVQNSAARPARGTGGEDGLFREETGMIKKIQKTDKGWKDVLTPEEYRVLRQAGTERPFTGKYNDLYEDGTYACGACGTPLFGSETKYDHGSGWPSFNSPIAENRLEYREDSSHGMVRTEVRCAACGSHLGHLFEDGPPPTRGHYCINSVALDFEPAGP